MAEIIRDENGGVKIVVFRDTWESVCEMAGTPTIPGPPRAVLCRSGRGGSTQGIFWICATMLLGGADAMLLASIAETDPLDGTIRFPGLELI